MYARPIDARHLASPIIWKACPSSNAMARSNTAWPACRCDRDITRGNRAPSSRHGAFDHDNDWRVGVRGRNEQGSAGGLGGRQRRQREVWFARRAINSRIKVEIGHNRWRPMRGFIKLRDQRHQVIRNGLRCLIQQRSQSFTDFVTDCPKVLWRTRDASVHRDGPHLLSG